jgi:hypothetical protein
MSATNGPKIVKDGLIVSLDSANDTTFKGIPTTNLTTDSNLFIYNNGGANLTTSITKTTETYRGAPIWRATYTPVNATGVSQFSDGTNPGIGIYVDFGIPGGGGTANRYTGYSMFVKSDKPLYSPFPVYTNASNVPGYTSPNTRYDDMGDGWYRAKTYWFDTVTRSDAKFWQINPSKSAINETITVYWAGPFKEDRNDSTQYVSPYCNGTRGTTVAAGGGWPDTSGFDNNGTFNGTPTYSDANQGSLVFNGTDHFITLNDLGTLPSYSIEGWFNISVLPGANQYPCVATNVYPGVNNNINFVLGFSTNGTAQFGGSFFNGDWRQTPTFQPVINTWYHCVFTYDGRTLSLYRNGTLFGSTTYVANPISSQGGVRIGRRWDNAEYLNGKIPVVRIYNRAITASEVSQNFNALRGRYSI